MDMVEDARPARRATIPEIARAVFWSFLGIRKRTAHEQDLVRLTLLQVVVAGIIGAVVFVLGLVLLVRTITS